MSIFLLKGEVFMNRQRGQVIVEFALILPLFLLMIFGLIYSGMLFHDYSTVSNMARSAAREAAILQGTTGYNTIEGYYLGQGEGLLTSLYKADSFRIKKGKEDNSPDEVYVIVTMKRNFSFPLIDIVLPDTFNIDYYMRKDQPSTSTGG